MYQSDTRGTYPKAWGVSLRPWVTLTHKPVCTARPHRHQGVLPPTTIMATAPQLLVTSIHWWCLCVCVCVNQWQQGKRRANYQSNGDGAEKGPNDHNQEIGPVPVSFCRGHLSVTHLFSLPQIRRRIHTCVCACTSGVTVRSSKCSARVNVP